MYDRRNDYLRRRSDRRRDYARRDMRMRDRYPMDYRRDSRRDYDIDYNDYAYDRAKDEYEMDLKEWSDKLKSKDRFGASKQQVIDQARNMGARFKDYSEEELYAIYLAMVSDYKSIANDYNTYIKMAIDFLEDDDIEVSPSEKVCIYLYQIVLGEE